MSDLDAIKAAGLNSAEHSALLLERHKSAQRLEDLLSLVRQERTVLEACTAAVAASEFALLSAAGLLHVEDAH